VENAAAGEKSSEGINRIITELSERKERYQGYADEMAQSGETQKSLTDGDSRLMMSNGKMEVCYNVQTAVDAKNKLIAEFEVTNEGNDKNRITPMSLKVQEILETDAITVIADAGYDSVQDIAAAMKRGVNVHVAGNDFDICIPAEAGEKTEITAHKNGRCVYNAERNIALCPMGNVLYPGFYKKAKGMGVFYNRAACRQCACKCSKEARGFRYQVPMGESDFSKAYNDKDLLVKQIRITPDKELIKQRKSIAEHPFGTVKQNMDTRYCLTKGLRNVCGEFSLAFLAYNLKRALTFLGVQD
jgi:hypothetical protein